jgi:hypothetical protein
MIGLGLFAIYFILACFFVYYLFSPRKPSWWIKVVTQSPACTYYFGPFDSLTEAESRQPEYIEDIKQEGAAEIISQIQRCQPEQLTICEDENEEELIESLRF